ncbi:AraC family transcriptional regulator [Chitinophaga lutea]|uniref:AraC family transcriptional regulator n=1 Tax=Chitinophaga lutea TaxID=2488634 RepID=A0A3N4PXC2_9BACT|nr:AraC family transcriptional regulator [Chitinophaga lutea]RPE08320.1 AraC family transcriptional regulator [Chitinophaga lutea]
MPRLLSIVAQQLPTEALRPYVAGYVFRTAAIRAKDAAVHKAMPLRSVSSIDFFMGDAFETTDCASGRVVPFARCTIRGPRTHRKYAIRLSGDLVSFSIRFTPAGLYALLGIPASEFSDEAIDGALVMPAVFPGLTERLMACTSLDHCIQTAEPYLLHLLQQAGRHIHPSPAVQEMAALIAGGQGALSIACLQQQVCLGKRQLERNFVKEVGVTPKMYSRMLRFSNMLQYKMRNSQTRWAALAYEFAYADQMHLIRDFRQFLGVTPSEFSADDFAF